MDPTPYGFLEYLYEGEFRSSLYAHSYRTIDNEKVEKFLDQYTAATRGYNPKQLDEGGAVPAELMKRLGEIGIFGLIIGTDYGGLGFTISEYLKVIESMAGADMAMVLVPLAHLSIGMKGILLFGNDQQKKHYLPKAASGEMVFGYALTEPDTGSDAQHIRTTATLSEDGTHYILNGTKTYITNANYAGAFTVFAQLDPANPGTMGAFIVEREWEGVSVGKDMPKMGLKVSSTAMVRFKDVLVPRENILGKEGDGFKIAMNILNYGRLGLGAASAGLMKQSLSDMSRRASTRTQFGVPIRNYQLIQEKMVAAKAHAFGASAITYFTAALIEQNPIMNVAIESSHCKLYGTSRCWNTLYDALQTAGGSGYLSTLPYEKRMRDFRVTTIFEGTTEIHTIYPPLSLFRNAGKLLSGKGAFGKLRVLRRISATVALRSLDERHPELREAIRVAARGERRLRRLLRYGLVNYGKDIASRQFYLRKMTELSLSVFLPVASVSYIKGRHDSDYPEEELAALSYLVEEAREMQRHNSRPERSRKEEAHDRLFKTIP